MDRGIRSPGPNQKMKVQLLKDGKLGKKNDIVEVNDDLGKSLIAGRVAGNPKKEKSPEPKVEEVAPEKGARKAK